MHKETLVKLREELTRTSQDEWMYKPIDQIIGFWHVELQGQRCLGSSYSERTFAGYSNL